MLNGAGILAPLASCATLLIPAVDLAKKYPATLDYSEPVRGREWTCDPEDVWSLSSFSFAQDKKLAVTLGPSTVAFGKHGSNVVWAVVTPDKPGPIRSSGEGDGEHVASLWMRFHPALVGKLFPAKTVKGNGPATAVTPAKRVCAWKMRSSWQAGDLPVIPWKKAIVLDAETTEGKRRFYMVDSEASTVKYEPFVADRALPPLAPMTQKEACQAFDDAWSAFDAEYAMFGVKPSVNWEKLREIYRARIGPDVRTTYEAAAVIADLLVHLEDLHVFVRIGNEYLPGYQRQRPLNASLEAIQKLEGWRQPGREIAWARTADGIGYVSVFGLGNQDLPQQFDEVLEGLADTWGLVLDLRFNGGGDEIIGRKIAGRFLDRSRVYSFSQYRSGPKHDQLGPKYPRECEPRGPWRYEAPVVVLWGQRTMSSAESLALMLARCPQVTTMGDRTAGSSANPRLLALAGGIEVNLPRWLDLDPDGKPIDAVGVPPKVRVDAKPEEFTTTRDPVLEAALEELRRRPESDRKPGRS
jgi:carboxyl-terminal processing protease